MERCASMMTSSNGNIFCVTGPLHKGQWRGALMFSLICAWINCSVNTGEAGDLRRHGASYYVIVIAGNHRWFVDFSNSHGVNTQRMNGGVLCQKQVSRTGASNPYSLSVGCNYVSLPLIPVSGTILLKWNVANCSPTCVGTNSVWLL